LFSLDETIIARATPHGAGGRGILRLSGDDCVRVLRDVFQTADFGEIRAEIPGIYTGTLTPWEPKRPVPCDLYFWPQERGYTGQCSVELHLWGSEPILDAVEHRILQSKWGTVRLAKPGEFTLRAFLAGRLDLTQAEAVLGVIDATDEHHLKIALNQLAGGIGLPLHRIQNALLDTLSHLEAGLDFADEGIDFISTGELIERLDEALKSLNGIHRKISDRNAGGEILRVLLIGPPNAGKSSLYNRLTDNHKGAIVSPIPGTTRDYLETPLTWDGVTFRLVDSAGIADFSDGSPDETAQVLARQMIEAATLLLVCVSAEDEQGLDESLFAHKPVIRVRTKCDLREITGTEIRTSAVSGAGLEKLKQKTSEFLRNRIGTAEVVPTTAIRCRDAIARAAEHLTAAWSLASQNRDEVLIASELRSALEQLGQVLGTVHTDDILDRVFSKFCIGK